MSLMGVDVGTTGVKAVIFSADGALLGIGYREYPLLYPGPPGWVELDSERIWQATKEAIRQAVAHAGNRDPVEAIAISSMGETAVPLDTGGKPLMNAIANLDTRAVAQAQRLEQRLGQQRVFALTGHPIHPMYSVPKLMWLKDERPELFARLWKFLCAQDFTAFRLGARDPAIDWSLASRTMGFDVVRKVWCAEVMQAAELSETLWAKPLPGGKPSAMLTVGLPTNSVCLQASSSQRAGTTNLAVAWVRASCGKVWRWTPSGRWIASPSPSPNPS